MSSGVKWGRSDEGFVDSKCGRYSISALFWGRVSPQEYKLKDRETGREAKCDTQRECKDLADEWSDVSE